MKQKTYTVFYKEISQKNCGTIVKKEQEYITDDYEDLINALKQIRVYEISDVEDIIVFTNSNKWSEESVLALYFYKPEYKYKRRNRRIAGSKFYKIKRKKKWKGHPNRFVSDNEPLLSRSRNRTYAQNNIPDHRYYY